MLGGELALLVLFSLFKAFIKTKTAKYIRQLGYNAAVSMDMEVIFL